MDESLQNSGKLSVMHFVKDTVVIVEQEVTIHSVYQDASKI